MKIISVSRGTLPLSTNAAAVVYAAVGVCLRIVVDQPGIVKTNISIIIRKVKGKPRRARRQQTQTRERGPMTLKWLGRGLRTLVRL